MTGGTRVWNNIRISLNVTSQLHTASQVFAKQTHVTSITLRKQPKEEMAPQEQPETIKP